MLIVGPILGIVATSDQSCFVFLQILARLYMRVCVCACAYIYEAKNVHVLHHFSHSINNTLLINY
jgi:hypothetical protein